MKINYRKRVTGHDLRVTGNKFLFVLPQEKSCGQCLFLAEIMFDKTHGVLPTKELTEALVYSTFWGLVTWTAMDVCSHGGWLPAPQRLS